MYRGKLRGGRKFSKAPILNKFAKDYFDKLGELREYTEKIRTYQEVARQQLGVRNFDENKTKHIVKLKDLLIKYGMIEVPRLPDIPYIYSDAFDAWEELQLYGRPSAMGITQHSFDTVKSYVELTDIPEQYRLERMKQIITIDIEYIKLQQQD